MDEAFSFFSLPFAVELPIISTFQKLLVRKSIMPNQYELIMVRHIKLGINTVFTQIEARFNFP